MSTTRPNQPDPPKKKDLWDKLGLLSALIASVFVPVALAFVGHMYSRAAAEAQNSLKYTELALSILKEKPTEDQKNIRKWAISIMSKHSGIPLDEQAQQELLTSRLTKAVDRLVLHGPVGRPIINEFVERIYLSDDLRAAINARDATKTYQILRPWTVSLVETLQNISDDFAPPRGAPSSSSSAAETGRQR